MQIGVLALQGDYLTHGSMLKKLKVDYRFVTTRLALEKCHGLIIPGGESTTMLKLIANCDLDDGLHDFIAAKKAIFGTCAGAILLAKKVSHPVQKSLECIDMAVMRNGYGRQLASSIKYCKF